MKVTIPIKSDLEIDLPMLPNFIKSGDTHFDVADLDDSTLATIADEWKAALILYAQQRRKGRKR